MPNTIVTVTDAKTWLGIDSGVTTYDGQLALLCNAVNAKIKSYCGTDFDQHVVTADAPETFDGGRSDTIMPRYLPLISVQNVWLTAGPSQSLPTSLDVTDYQFDEEGIYLTNGMMTEQGRGTVAIAYTGGYVAVPDDVKMAGLLAVEAMYLRKTNKTVGVSSRTKSVGSGTAETETYTGAWNADVGLPVASIALLQDHKFMEWPSSTNMATRNY